MEVEEEEEEAQRRLGTGQRLQCSLGPTDAAAVAGTRWIQREPWASTFGGCVGQNDRSIVTMLQRDAAIRSHAGASRQLQ